MQNIKVVYQNYNRVCLYDKSISTHICSIFSDFFRGSHARVVLMTTGQPTNLEQSIETDLKSENTSKVLERLEKAKDASLCELSKRLWGSVFYYLNKKEEFVNLDKIRIKTKDLNINCGEGALTTLVKSYVARNQSLRAARMLDEMRNTGLLRHTRTYFPVITSLAENGHQNKAFELFYDLQRHTFKSNQTINLLIPPNMAVALIMSCVQRGCISEYIKAQDVLFWFNQSGQVLTLEILNAIEKWLDNDPINNWTMNNCQISSEGLCSNCGNYLNKGLLTSNEMKALKLDILDTVENIFNSKEKVCKREKFENYLTFLKQCPPCDVIVDGMSMGLSSNVDKQKRKFNFNALLKICDHFIHQGRNVLVILNTSIKPSYLKNNVYYFISDVGDDDLYVIYASAVWNLAPFLITRDRFREHRFLLALHNHSSYIKWVRSHTIKVAVKRDQLMFQKQKYDPVVQTGNSTWHLPLVNGSWFCAKKLIS